MSWLAAELFTRLQAAPFYQEFHRTAVAALPDGMGRTWLDVGCGPGLISRLASERGYRVTGADSDSAMLTAARRLTAPGHNIRYEHEDLAGLVACGIHADVVSASSLLVVLPDAAVGLGQLLFLVRPGGRLLLFEANEHMRRRATLRLWLKRSNRRKNTLLLLWAMFRSGQTVPSDLLRRQGAVPLDLPLLGGMVTAWQIFPPVTPVILRQP